MYGAGHGGIEAFLILGMSSMSNLLTAAMINGGLMEKTMTALEPAQQEVTYHQLSVLLDLTPALPVPDLPHPVGAIEVRIACRLALSISCYYSAVKTGRKLHLAAAFGLHFYSGLSDCGVCLHDSYMGIGAGIADGSYSNLCSGIQVGLSVAGREKSLTETEACR